MTTPGCNNIWSWNFGDGSGLSSSQSPANHIYKMRGDYTIELTASNLGGTSTSPRDGYGDQLIRRRQRGRGQALVEFALALPIFLMLMMAVFDLGRAIYMYNGVTQAAREIARVTSVYPCTDLEAASATRHRPLRSWRRRRASSPTSAIRPSHAWISTDRRYTDPCVAGMQVKVVIFAPYSPVTPGLSLVGTLNLQSSSTVSIQ